MSDLTDAIRHDVATLDLVREHLARRHDGPEAVPGCMGCDHNRYRQHSITLNTVGWKLAEALGETPEDADQIEGNPIEQAEKLIAERDAIEADRDRLSDELAKACEELADTKLERNPQTPTTRPAVGES